MNKTNSTNDTGQLLTNYILQFNQISSYTLYVWTATLLLLVVSSVNLSINFARRTFSVVALIPECCIQVIFGFICGIIIHFSSATLEGTLLSLFTPNAFFTFILPPILIEAGYFMPRKDFSVNIVFILTFAVFGTILNCFILAGALYGVGQGGVSPDLSFLELLMYCAIISAVDPVAVIAVFQELNVNTSLFIVEFGESLLNDGVSLVLFQIFQAMIQMKALSTTTLGLLGIVKFLWIMIGGTLTGLLCGFLGSMLARCCTVNYPTLQPFFIYGTCFFAYTSCNLLSISSIFGVIACSFFIRPYAEHNMSKENRINLDYSIRLIAHMAEMMIFVFLGLVTVALFFTHPGSFEVGFSLWNILFVTIVRFIVVFFLGTLVNHSSTRKLTINDQLVVSYSGLRGGIAFGMIYSLSIANRIMYVQTTLIVIFFTVFIQGGTVGHLLKYLKVDCVVETPPSVCEMIMEKSVENMVTGMRDILGTTDSRHVYHKMRQLSSNYFSPVLERKPVRCEFDDFRDIYRQIRIEEVTDNVFHDNYASRQLTGMRRRTTSASECSQMMEEHKV